MKRSKDDPLYLSTEADQLDRETELLVEAGYFDAEGRPMEGEAGKKIFAECTAKLRAEIAAKGAKYQTRKLQ